MIEYLPLKLETHVVNILCNSQNSSFVFINFNKNSIVRHNVKNISKIILSNKDKFYIKIQNSVL